MRRADEAGFRVPVQDAASGRLEFAEAVRACLSQQQKSLPPSFLYDEVGTALFDAISLLPEYGLTRADERVLRRHAGEFIEAAGSPTLVAELGSGTGRKTRW